MSQSHQSPNEPLTTAQARAVIYVAPRRRPMGELLDEGAITRTDLRWAAQNAYVPQIKAAARVLLTDLDARTPATVPPAPLTRPQAAPGPAATRNTAKGASIPGSHAAAPALPDDLPRYGPRVVVASTYLANKEEAHHCALAIGIAVGVMFVLYCLFEAAQKLLSGQGIGVMSAVAFVVGLALITWYVRRHVTAWRNVQRGRRGEEQIVDALRTALDSRWTIYRNVQLADKQADLDLVLVGPGGVWAVQVKNYRGALRYTNGWQRRRGGQWVACDARMNPETQVKRQAMQLHQYLAKQGITRWVDTAIALAEALPEKDVAASPVPVWLPFSVERLARGLTTRTPLGTAELGQINALLGKHADAQRAVEADRQKRGTAA